MSVDQLIKNEVVNEIENENEVVYFDLVSELFEDDEDEYVEETIWVY